MSQNAQILARLKSGEQLTTLTAMQPPLYCCRLSERIRELQAMGNRIDKRTITTINGKRVTMYYMSDCTPF